MKHLKRWLVLFLTVVLALSLLTGCGNSSKALGQVLADLISVLYNNVSVEVDSSLTTALKKASAAGDTQEEVLSALLEELNLSGVRLTLGQLREGQQGDRGVELAFQPGADPDAAARIALNGWASAFSSLPDDGRYGARVAMIEADSGYYIAVDVEVIQAGRYDDMEDDGYHKLTIWANWQDKSSSDRWNVKIGDSTFCDIPADQPLTIDLPSGQYTVIAWNSPSGITINGPIAAVNLLEEKCIPLPDVLFSSIQQVQMQKGTSLICEMKPQLRDLSINVNCSEGRYELIQSMTMTLSGIAGTFNLSAGQATGEPFATAAEASRSGDGQIYTAKMRLLGTVGTEQKLEVDINFADGGRQQIIVVSVTEKLCGFNTGDKGEPYQIEVDIQLDDSTP